MGYPVNGYFPCFGCMAGNFQYAPKMIEGENFCDKCYKKFKCYNLKEINKLVLEPKIIEPSRQKNKSCTIL